MIYYTHSSHCNHYHHTETTRPELKELFKHVTPRYAAYWNEIGIYLDFRPEQLEIIKLDNLGDVKRSCNDMFIKWLERDPNASWEKFFNGFDLAIGSQPTEVPSSK